MTATVHVTGVGMIPFAKPGKSTPYSATGEQAARAALIDAGLESSRVQQAHRGYVYSDSPSGQVALYGLGQTYPEADYVSGQMIATGDRLDA